MTNEKFGIAILGLVAAALIGTLYTYVKTEGDLAASAISKGCLVTHDRYGSYDFDCGVTAKSGRKYADE